MKKILFALLFVLAALLAACGGEAEESAVSTGEGSASVSTPSATESNTESSPEDTSAESRPEESEPAESQPEESQPEESQPEESQPEESQPEESQPEESQPEELPSDLSTLKYSEEGISFDNTRSGAEQTVLKAVCGDKTVLHFAKENSYVVLPQKAEWIGGAQSYGTYLFYAFAPGKNDALICYQVDPGSQSIIETTEVALPDACRDARVFVSWGDGGVYLSVVSEKTGEMLHLFTYSRYEGRIKKEVEIKRAPVCSEGSPALMRFFDSKTGVMVYHVDAKDAYEESVFFTYNGGKTWEGFGKAPFGCYDDEEAQIVDVADVTCGAEPMYAVTFKNGDKITRYAGGDPMEWMYSEVLSWQEVPADLDGYRLEGVMGDIDLLFQGENDGGQLVWYDGKVYSFPASHVLSVDMKGAAAIIVSKHSGNSKFLVFSLLPNRQAIITELVPPFHSGGEEGDELTAYLQVIDPQTAVLGITGIYGEHMEEQLLAFYRSEDGGKTWENVQPEGTYYAWDYREYISIFHFFDSQTGIRSRDYRIPELLEWRTMVTFDGGRDWQAINDLPYPAGTDGYTEIMEVGKCDDVYWMTVFSANSDGDRAYMLFVSTDLLNWAYVDMDAIGFVPESISADKNVIWGKDGDGYAVHVADWKQTFRLPTADTFTCDLAEDTLVVCLGDTLYGYDAVSFAVYSYSKGKDTPAETELTIPKTSDGKDAIFESVILQVVDTDTAFVTIIGENDDDEILAIYRTVDGGKTWENRVETITEIWDCWFVDFSAFHFWDADKGIYCRDLFTDESLTDRVRITFDGGKTWNELWRIVLEEEDPVSLMVGSADYRDGVYSISLYRFGEPGVTVATYVSTDLLNWTKE